MILKNRASDRVALGETDRALADFRSALTFFRVTGNRREEGVTQFEIGTVLLTKGEPTAALRQYGLAWPSCGRSATSSSRHSRSTRWGSPASPPTDLGARSRTFSSLWSCFACLPGPARRGHGRWATSVGPISKQGRDRRGRETSPAGPPAGPGREASSHEASTLEHLARGERSLGDLDVGAGPPRGSAPPHRIVRESIPASAMRASFIGRTHDRYDLLVDILMALHAKTAGRGIGRRSAARERAGERRAASSSF